MNQINSNQSNYLFEECPIWKAIAKLAIPTIISQIILVIYNMADTFFVGLAQSDAKLTAVTICMPAFMILSAIANLFGIGGSSVISRALGKNKIDKAKASSAFSFWGCLFIGLLYVLTIFLFKDLTIDLLGGKDAEVHAYADTYLLWAVEIGGIVTILNSFFGHLFRSEGKSFLAGFGIILGGILNILLDPLFMFVIFEKGNEVMGAAVATFLSNLLAVIYFIIILIIQRKKTVLNLKPSKRMFKKSVVYGVLLTGLPACLMTLFENISYAVLDNLMAGYGIVYQAGIGVAKKINMLAHSIVRGMSQGVLPLIAYNYAKKNIKRMNQSLYYSAFVSIAIATLCMITCLMFNQTLISIFIQQDSASLTYGSEFLMILCIGAPFSAWAYAIISFFQATKRSFKSFILAILRKGLLDIPMMFIINPNIPIYGIVMATPIVDIICCFVAVVLFIHFRKIMIQKYGNAPQQETRVAISTSYKSS
ncbi:MAG TPA: hypothetical protein IAD46_01805 [Candidatus Pelethenecus faecipullorum]|uniref:MATE family efflux transporter n=1 Tax=Candidatus Pelethenecus faecipullorum TaxID=2840900 RepID=A0A9D1GQI6_9MOLU|nr:hypothetical protein [Candidatus Pelethenecus faecipullorum]